MKIEQLDHFGIEVADLARAQQFYTEVLGLPVVMRMHNQVLLDCGGQNLALFEVPRAPLDADARKALIGSPLGKGHHAFRVSANDFASARERLKAAGVESATPIDWGDHDCLYFLDPDGNLLELINYR
jgi:catechol 2,3-dioxygenase-like lactoylglutathione lyase family enzyme